MGLTNTGGVIGFSISSGGTALFQSQGNYGTSAYSTMITAIATSTSIVFRSNRSCKWYWGKIYID